MGISRFLDDLMEFHLRKEKKRGDIFVNASEIHEQLLSTRQLLEKLLDDTELFHGSGRLQYRWKGSSKYEGVTDTVNDTFLSIVQHGLMPVHDPYAERFTDGHHKETISLTRSRMYARVYAGMFSYQKDLQYEYGSRAFWWFHYLSRMAMRTCFSHSFIEKSHRRVSLSDLWEKGSRWTQSFRKNRANPVTVLLQVMSRGASDIPENHPVIVGCRAHAVPTLMMNSGVVNMYETRVAGCIPPGSLQYIEVPLSVVAERRKEVRELGIDIPIIPMEFVELLMREKHFSVLMEPRG